MRREEFSGKQPDVERVFVVPRIALERRELLRHGFREGGVSALLEAIDAEGRFMDRADAERDPDFKQIIPYSVVRSGDAVFVFSRTKKGGESRLHELASIGVGGHINPIDGGIDGGTDAADILERGRRRELEEELRWEVDRRPRWVGLLNDDRDEVGRVHFGVVSVVETASTDVYVRETEILKGRFVGLDTLRSTLPAMETWSQLVASALFV